MNSLTIKPSDTTNEKVQTGSYVNQYTTELCSTKEVELSHSLAATNDKERIAILSKNLPEDSQLRKALADEIDKESHTLTEKMMEHEKAILEQKQNVGPTSVLSSLFNRANKLAKPSFEFTPLMKKQEQINKASLETTAAIQRRKHGLLLANSAFENYLRSKDYDLNKIVNSIGLEKQEDCAELSKLNQDSMALELMKEQDAKSKQLQNLLESNQYNELIKNLNNGSLGGELKTRLETELDDVFKLDEKLAKLPSETKGKLGEITDNVKEMVSKLVERISSLFGKSNLSAPKV